MNIFEAADAIIDDTDDLERAEELFKLIWRFYLHNCSLITREMYVVMQNELAFKSSFEEHSQNMVDGIPDDVSRVVHHIASFLKKFPVFKSPIYVSLLTPLIEAMVADSGKQVQLAHEILKSTIQEREAAPNPGLTHHCPVFEANVRGTHVVLPTFGNPLMTSLYSVMFACFEQINSF